PSRAVRGENAAMRDFSTVDRVQETAENVIARTFAWCLGFGGHRHFSSAGRIRSYPLRAARLLTRPPSPWGEREAAWLGFEGLASARSYSLQCSPRRSSRRERLPDAWSIAARNNRLSAPPSASSVRRVARKPAIQERIASP